ncbi:MAG: YtxH domain-containing protein [Flavitalea sp.]
MKTSSKVLLGLIGAAAAGAAIGLLLAPEKGSDVRKKVKNAANDWACQLADLFAESKSELNSIKNKATRSARDLKANAEDRYNAVREGLS